MEGDGNPHAEVHKPLNFNSTRKNRDLTPLRVLRGVICLLVFVLTAFMMLVYFGFPSAVIFRFVSVRYSRKATSFFFGAWLALWPFLFEKINKTRVVFSGESVPPRERVLLIANHRTQVDWMYLWDLALRKGRIGFIKYVLKSSLMKLPIFGWAFHIMEFIPVERRWEIDEPVMQKMLSTFKDPREPLWLALFPEGTDFNEQNCIRSKKYAAENGLPVLNHVLLPKTKGFLTCLELLKDSIDAVYDITIGYKHRCPSFLDNAFGVDPREVHIHVRLVPLTDIPVSDEKTGSWLVEAFALKDQLLSDFYLKGHFPREKTEEEELSTLKCWLNFLFVMVLTGLCLCLTFSSSMVWFKVYVCLVCAYLAPATYFSIRPYPLLAL